GDTGAARGPRVSPYAVLGVAPPIRPRGRAWLAPEALRAGLALSPSLCHGAGLWSRNPLSMLAAALASRIRERRHGWRPRARFRVRPRKCVWASRFIIFASCIGKLND
ncbi:unnamed protein product, partial [Amoebophrya sp. A120]